MSRPQQRCPVCKLEGQAVSLSDLAYTLRVECARCGSFTISRSIETKGRDVTARLSAWLRERGMLGVEIPVLADPIFDETINRLPRYRPSQKQQRLLGAIESLTDSPGAEVALIPERDLPLAWAQDKREFEFYMNNLLEDGLIKYSDTLTHSDPLYTVVITAKGWAYLEQSQPETQSAIGGPERTGMLQPTACDGLGSVTLNEGGRNSSPQDADTTTDVVIITALKKEEEAVLRHLGPGVPVVTKSRQYHRLSIESDDGARDYDAVLLSLPGMGNVQAAIATTQAIDVWDPGLVLLCGITAGISDEVPTWNSKWLGDLLIADQVLAYEPGKLVDGEVQRRYEVLRPAFHLLEASRNLPVETWALSAKRARPDGSSSRVLPKVHTGVVASGEKVIADAGFADELKSDWSQLAGIEMEGYGTALATYQAETAPAMLLVKGICDWADSDKNDDWQEYAADIAATFVSALLKNTSFPAQRKAQAVRQRSAQYSGKAKVLLNRRIGDGWQELADYFEIPSYEQKGFPRASEMRDIWEWLEARGKLDALEEGLAFIDRSDLVKVLLEDREGR